MKFRHPIRRITTTGLLVLLLVLGPFVLTVQAVEILIDTSGFGATDLDPGNQGRWGLDVAPSYYGNKTFDLQPGNHKIFIGSRADGGAFGEIPFHIDDAGNVTVTTSAATGGMNQLTFNTTDVEIDPGLYTGDYEINYVARFSGPATVKLIKDHHFMLRFDIVFVENNSTTFFIDSSGNVTTTWISSFNCSGNILSFKTGEVVLDPAAYSGIYSVRYVNNSLELSGPAVRQHVTGLTYRLGIGSTYFTYTVAENGTVTSEDPDSLSASGNTVTFVTVPLMIDPGQYSLHYTPAKITSNVPVLGELNANVVCNATYGIRLSGPTSQNIHVGCDGIVTVENDNSATGGANKVTYKNVDISIDPGNYLGGLKIANFASTGGNTVTLTLIPSVAYRGNLGHGISDSANGFNSFFDFDVAASGIVMVANEGAMSASGSAITFNNANILLDPVEYTGEYYLQSASDLQTGSSVLTVVPNISYMLKLNGMPGNALFTVAEPCAVNPPQVAVAGQLFNISCGSPDSDDDGVPDADDNCPANANADQLDIDGDSYGDVCDADLDGDGVANSADNCVDVSNVDQSDLDGDSLGDVCDNDNDGDAVPDEADNCLGLPNADQADTDLDGMGDACDNDDDNDLVADEFDNCPLSANADQADYDKDGEGDVCDGDRDNDGVGNETDRCELTPANVMIDEEGCSASQFIEKSCRWEDYGQHGKYVSCVAHAAQNAADKGLIDPKDKARYIKDAAQNK